MARRALVAYGTRNGSTQGMAKAGKGALRTHRIEAGWRPASEVRDVTPYGVVVLGGALYAGRRPGDAVRFARRHRASLLERAVGLFGGGPLDASADERDIPPGGGAECLPTGSRAVSVHLLGLYGPAASGPPR